MRLLFLITLVLFGSLSLPTQAASLDSKSRLEQSRQLILVRTPGWDSLEGELQVYHRTSTHSAWHKVGEIIPVVVGQNGMAWGAELAPNQWPGPVKKEGDLRSPVGAFYLNPAFGFDQPSRVSLKMDYFHLDVNSVCVDDPHSQYYNHLLDASKVTQKDWNSAEQMREIPLYKWGAMVEYNTDHPQAGAGSCIFFHVWRRPDQGTAGCVAMAASPLLKLLSEINPAQKPVVVMISAPAYDYVKKDWGLPGVSV